MANRIHIVVGAVEVEYERDQSFTLDEIKGLLDRIETLAGKVPSPAPIAPPNVGAASPEPVKTAGSLKLHINSIAEKLAAKSGSDVARAAAASLQLVDGKEKFTRSELLSRMKEATKYYKDSMSSNLTKAIESLLNGKFNQIGADVYSLTAAEYSALGNILAH